MKVVGHTVISLTAGSALYYFTRSLPGVAWFLIAGILIDLDHYLDYAREKGISFDLKKVYGSCKNGHINFKNLTLFFHSCELAAVLWLVIFLFGLNIVWKCAAMGFTLHLIIDMATNPLAPAGYFLWFRIANNFETKKMYREGVDYAPKY